MLMGHILIRLLIAMGVFKVSPELSDSPTWFCGAFSDRFLLMACYGINSNPYFLDGQMMVKSLFQ